MGEGITLEDLIRESPFTIREIVEKYGVHEYTVRNKLKYHSFLFSRKKEKPTGGKRGRPRYVYSYIGGKPNED